MTLVLSVNNQESFLSFSSYSSLVSRVGHRKWGMHDDDYFSFWVRRQGVGWYLLFLFLSPGVDVRGFVPRAFIDGEDPVCRAWMHVIETPEKGW